MDPTTNLRDLRAAVELLDATRGRDELVVESVITLFADLNEWLTRGGFLPAQWAPAYVNASTEPDPSHTPAGVAPDGLGDGGLDDDGDDDLPLGHPRRAALLVGTLDELLDLLQPAGWPDPAVPPALVVADDPVIPRDELDDEAAAWGEADQVSREVTP